MSESITRSSESTDHRVEPEAVTAAFAALLVPIEERLPSAEVSDLLEESTRILEFLGSPESPLLPSLRDEMPRLLMLFQEARHLVRVQLREPPGDPMQ